MQIDACLREHTCWKSASSKQPEKKSDFSFTQQPPHSVHHSGPRTPVQRAALLFLSSHLWFISDWCMANVQTVGLQFDSGYYMDMFFNLEIMIHVLCGGTVRDYDKVIHETRRPSFIPPASSVLMEQCSVSLLCQTNAASQSFLPSLNQCVLTET